MNYKDLCGGERLPKKLSDEEFNYYLAEAQAGDASAKKEIIAHNLRLVAKIVFIRFKSTEHDLNDLFDIGVEGLVKAIDDFDVSKGTQFSTFATTCIKNSIRAFLKSEAKERCLIRLDEPINSESNKDSDEDACLKDFVSDSTIKYVEDYEKKEMVSILMEIIEEKLTDVERSCVKLFYLSNMKQQDIAQELEIAKNSITRILKRAKEKIIIELIKRKDIDSSPEFITDENELKAINKRISSKIAVKVSIEDFSCALKLLSQDEYKSLLNKFSVRDAVIILLSNGYINNQIYCADAISEFLLIPKNEILDVLNTYKNYDGDILLLTRA